MVRPKIIINFEKLCQITIAYMIENNLVDLDSKTSPRDTNGCWFALCTGFYGKYDFRNAINIKNAWLNFPLLFANVVHLHFNEIKEEKKSVKLEFNDIEWENLMNCKEEMKDGRQRFNVNFNFIVTNKFQKCKDICCLIICTNNWLKKKGNSKKQIIFVFFVVF